MKRGFCVLKIWLTNTHGRIKFTFLFSLLCMAGHAVDQTRSLGAGPAVIHIPVLALTSCVIWEKLIRLPPPQFLICKVGTTTVLTSPGPCENQRREDHAPNSHRLVSTNKRNLLILVQVISTQGSKELFVSSVVCLLV